MSGDANSGAVIESGTDNKTKTPKPPKATGKGKKGAAAKEKTRKPAQKAQQKCAYMYVGPNIPGGRMFTGSLYRDNLPKHLDDLFNKVPEIKKLCVDVQTLPKIKKEVTEQGTEAHRLYKHIEMQIREGAFKNGV